MLGWGKRLRTPENAKKVFSVMLVLFGLSVITLIASIAFGTLDDSGDNRVASAIDHFESERYEEAIALLEESLDYDTWTYEQEFIYTLIGRSHQGLDELDTAIEYYQKALETNPKYHGAWMNKGIAYRLLGDLENAEKCYFTALEIKPDYPELHASIGALYIYKGEPDKAIEYLNRSIELDSQMAIAHSNLAIALAVVGRFDEAEQSLAKALSLGYENGEIVREYLDELMNINDADH
jgi:tetratricopeptide (TPR) repeat protein